MRRPPLLEGFAPVARPDARVLVLGSMPGAASLAAGQYYAHPRNAFWPMVEAVWDIPRTLPYEDRIGAVVAARVAIWDVLSHCRRPSSLDADIEAGSATVNDFARFFARHAQVGCVAFNGAAAETYYRRHVLPGLPPGPRQVRLLRLPSTSPAHAALAPGEKILAWQVLRDFSQPAATGAAALHPQPRAARI